MAEMEWMEDFQRALSKYGVTVTEIPGKGRGFVTTRDFVPGVVIICEEPYAAAPNEASVGLVCDSCFSSNLVKKFRTCQVVCYCGPTCEVIPSSDTNNYNLIKASDSYTGVGGCQLIIYAQNADHVSRVLPSFKLNRSEIINNFSKMSRYTNTICDAELGPHGTGLFPIVSMINHSCVPNSVLIFEGREAHVRATEHIPKNTEVSISYIETAAAKEKRQSDLKQYFFTCCCSRCLKNYDEEDVYLEGYRCCDSKCTGVLLDSYDEGTFECQQCGTARSPLEVVFLENRAAQLSEKASADVSIGNYAKAYSIYKAIEGAECDLYHPFSLNLLKTRKNLLKMAMEMEDWESALAYCKLIIEAYQRIYPAIHPMTGLQFYRCGKIEWLLNYTGDALVSYTKAADILKITHGTTSPFMKELLAKIEEAHTVTSHKLSSRERESG